jgi:DNA-binding HxlR family transcriptional regulator
VIGGKWKSIILWHLSTAEAPRRFGILRPEIPNATEKMIVQQLRELEAAGIVKRRVYREVPPRVEYSLTEEGKELRTRYFSWRESMPLARQSLEALCAWGERYAERIRAEIRCGRGHGG